MVVDGRTVPTRRDATRRANCPSVRVGGAVAVRSRREDGRGKTRQNFCATPRGGLPKNRPDKAAARFYRLRVGAKMSRENDAEGGEDASCGLQATPITGHSSPSPTTLSSSSRHIFARRTRAGAKSAPSSPLSLRILSSRPPPSGRVLTATTTTTIVGTDIRIFLGAQNHLFWQHSV